MTDRTPTTEAGRALLESTGYWGTEDEKRQLHEFVLPQILAIEAEARQTAVTPHDCVAVEAEILRLEARQQDGEALRLLRDAQPTGFEIPPVEWWRRRDAYLAAHPAPGEPE